MSLRLRKILLLVLAAALLAGSGAVQQVLNRERDKLGLTRVEPLENAPPILAFTTVALGGFRGLIANWLWVRATNLQDEDKFFEQVQLTDWITKMEPHFTTVWLYQAWNMAYNISVKFKDHADRWRWLKRGVELLRDEGLKYNPNDVLIHRELAWLFQDKLGKYTDDASLYYKQQWCNAMAEVFANQTPNLDELINPQTDDARRRAALLTNVYKLDAGMMKKVDEMHGPLEWRLPESHAIYWASLGIQKAEENPTRADVEELIVLRRVILQSLLMSFQRGRMESNIVERVFEFGPNLDVIPKLDAAYQRAFKEETDEDKVVLTRAHRNFLREAVYFLYVNNRIPDAANWFRELGEKYPDQPILDSDTNSLPRRLTLDQYAIACVQADITGSSQARVNSAIEGLLINSYRSLILDQDDRAIGLKSLARKVHEAYMKGIPPERMEAIGLASFERIDRRVRDLLLAREGGFPLQARQIMRSKVGMPPEAAEAPREPAPPPMLNNTNAAPQLP